MGRGIGETIRTRGALVIDGITASAEGMRRGNSRRLESKVNMQLVTFTC